MNYSPKIIVDPRVPAGEAWLVDPVTGRRVTRIVGFDLKVPEEPPRCEVCYWRWSKGETELPPQHESGQHITYCASYTHYCEVVLDRRLTESIRDAMTFEMFIWMVQRFGYRVLWIRKDPIDPEEREAARRCREGDE